MPWGDFMSNRAFQKSWRKYARSEGKQTVWLNIYVGMWYGDGKRMEWKTNNNNNWWRWRIEANNSFIYLFIHHSFIPLNHFHYFADSIFSNQNLLFSEGKLAIFYILIMSCETNKQTNKTLNTKWMHKLPESILQKKKNK